ncbi:uncharacterized protein CCOS01_10184 [Colletotrichum costaricense]|uniref:Nephrocystin 3-like N-terminal domain-containing protein n=1 Tax=Colletotrichum costaricense TaxID=1209916 RepID=A0AAJ0DZ01_9PEZI|nr:uncharacterized protein CCOS01_10184 [Colletotrichum costaricense]KAK1522472.1 hypothetical protein CCOS01_10184 [Colletotrichum costaricense]
MDITRQRRLLLERLSPGDRSSRKFQETAGRRVGTIGEWFLQSLQVQHWAKSQGPQFLWVRGDASTGKSCISSLLVEHLSATQLDSGIKSAVACVQFENTGLYHSLADFGDAITSIARQIVSQLPESSEALRRLISTPVTVWTWWSDNFQVIWAELEAYFEKIDIVLDGLDDPNPAAFLDFMAKLRLSDKESPIKIVLLSRSKPFDEVLRRFQGASLEVRASQEDMIQYLQQSFQSNHDVQAGELAKSELAQTLTRWAGLFDHRFMPISSQDLLHSASPTGFDVLEAVSRELSQANALQKGATFCELAVASITQSAHGDLIMTILYLLIAAKKTRHHLNGEAILDALRMSDQWLAGTLLATTEDLARMCSDFVFINEQIQVWGIKSPLLAEHLDERRATHCPTDTIAGIILRYLSNQEFTAGACGSSTALKRRFKEHPLLSFTARNLSLWMAYVDVESISAAFLQFSSKAASIDSYLQAAEAWEFNEESSYEELEAVEERWNVYPKGYSALHLAAHLGAGKTIVGELVRLGADVEGLDRMLQTPLHVAAYGAQFKETIRVLLQHGSDVSALDDGGQEPLSIALVHGSVGTVRILIDHGAKFDTSDEDLLGECLEEQPQVYVYLIERGLISNQS